MRSATIKQNMTNAGVPNVTQVWCHEIGGARMFHGIAIKPGKPTMLARIEGRPVIGMPGNPTSCLSNGYLLLAPAAAALAGRAPFRHSTVRARLIEDLRGPVDKMQACMVGLVGGEAASVFKESGTITSMSRADGFVTLPVGVERLEAGQEVEVTLL